MCEGRSHAPTDTEKCAPQFVTRIGVGSRFGCDQFQTTQNLWTTGPPVSTCLAFSIHKFVIQDIVLQLEKFVEIRKIAQPEK